MHLMITLNATNAVEGYFTQLPGAADVILEMLLKLKMENDEVWLEYKHKLTFMSKQECNNLSFGAEQEFLFQQLLTIVSNDPWIHYQQQQFKTASMTWKWNAETKILTRSEFLVASKALPQLTFEHLES